MQSTISYSINGIVPSTKEDWLKWLKDAYQICDMLSITPNECDIGSEKGNNIRSVKNWILKFRAYMKREIQFMQYHYFSCLMTIEQ